MDFTFVKVEDEEEGIRQSWREYFMLAEMLNKDTQDECDEA